jgi:hypothetical protein
LIFFPPYIPQGGKPSEKAALRRKRCMSEDSNWTRGESNLYACAYCGRKIDAPRGLSSAR